MWSYYAIRPISTDAAPRIFYAPDLDGALAFARRVWGSATLECISSWRTSPHRPHRPRLTMTEIITHESLTAHPPSITVPIVLSTGKRIDTTFALHYRVAADDLDRLTPAERMEYSRLRTHVLDSNLTIHSNL